MGTQLFAAFSQWADRPEDERFESVEALHQYCSALRHNSVSGVAKSDDLKVLTDQGSLALVGSTGAECKPTNYSFGQLSRLVGAPASYLEKLPAHLAASCLNEGLGARAKRGENTDVRLLLTRDPNGQNFARALTSRRYVRIWNNDVTERLLGLGARGWRIPPARPAFPGQKGTRPATEADLLQVRDLPLSIKVGDPIAPAGLYASDRDLFAFMVNESLPVVDPETGRPLFRGFFVKNSEVGDASFSVTSFLYDAICGNHIVWGAQEVREARVRHVGRNAEERAWGELDLAVATQAERSAVADVERIIRARSTMVADTPEAVVAKVSKLGAPKGAVMRAMDIAEEHRDWYHADPRSAWGLANGLTELSQQEPHASKREALDRVAGELVELSF